MEWRSAEGIQRPGVENDLAFQVTPPPYLQGVAPRASVAEVFEVGLVERQILRAVDRSDEVFEQRECRVAAWSTLPAKELGQSIANQLAQSTFRDIGDKAVSAGEMSRLRFLEIEIARAHMGLVSKDDSTVEGRDLELRGGEIGFAAFRKKAEFGSASIAVNRYHVEGVASLYQLETGSTLTLDSETMPANAENLRQRFYPGGASE